MDVSLHLKVGVKLGAPAGAEQADGQRRSFSCIFLHLSVGVSFLSREWFDRPFLSSIYIYNFGESNLSVRVSRYCDVGVQEKV